MNENKILLIIPAYNEEKSILKTCSNIYDYKLNHNENYDFIVINDGSLDGTQKVLEENNLPHLNLCINSGIGNAVQTGYKYAKVHNYDIAIQYDGDGQHDVKYINKLIKPILDGEANLVIGSRFIDSTSSDFKSSYARRVGIKLISFFIKLFTSKKIFDTTSGFRAADKKIIEQFSNEYPSEYPEPVSSVTLIKKQFKITEIPVSMNERTDGSSSIKAWKSIYYMFNVILSITIEALGGYKNEH